jgi:hypothetical protein
VSSESGNYMIYLLTAIWLLPGGSSAVQYTFTQKQYIEQHDSLISAPVFASGIYLTTKEKAWKNLSQGSRRVPVGTMKTEYTERFGCLRQYCTYKSFSLDGCAPGKLKILLILN